MILRSAKPALLTAHRGRIVLTMLFMLLTTATAWAQDLPPFAWSFEVNVETQDGASGTVSVTYTNESGTSVNGQDISSGGTITTSSSNTAFTLTITPATGCEIAEFRRAQGNKNISYPTLTENNGHFTYSGTSSIAPYTYTIKFGLNSDYYFVRFNPGLRGQGTMTDQAILKNGTANLSLCTFTGIGGSVFAGWNTRLDGTGISYADGASITPTTSFTLYAQWMDCYTVHYDANGGTGTMADQGIATNANANLTANTFTREGYVFAGWNTVADGSGTAYTDGQSVRNLAAATETITLYAQWTPTYTVHFDANGGTGTMVDQTFVVGKSQALSANAFTREGYIFVCWNTQFEGDGTSYTDGRVVKNIAAAGKTVTLYAIWQPAYTVHFNANGGSGTMADQIHILGTWQSLTVNTFTRTGYVFAGWNTEANGSGTAYTDGERVRWLTYTAGATVNLYAQWTPVYTVHFNANGGSGTMADQTFGIGLAQALTANVFTREGYYFAGWNTQADGLGTTYADGASVTDLTTTANASVNLYAKWAEHVTADYVDANGDAHTLTDCKEITPDYMPIALAGNYIVKENVTYTSKVTLSGNTTIVLANGKTMSIGTATAPLSTDDALHGYVTNSLTIYGQSLDAATAGWLEVYSTGYEAICLYDGSYFQHSGNVKLINSLTNSNNNSALSTGGSITIDGGTFVATVGTEMSYAINASDNINISGGSVTANATGADSYGMRSRNSINLTWTHATDRVTASGYKAIDGTVSLSKRFAFDDGGTVTLATTANMGGKTLRPAALVTFEANGGSDVAAQPVFIGTTATAPTPSRTGYDFSGWSLGGNAYDFSTPVTDDITLTAQWDIIQFVVDDLTYKWNDAVPNSVMVIECELGDNESIAIPNTVEHNGVTYDVTAIGDDAFGDKTTLASIVFPAKLVSIGSRAFKDCTALSVTIPAGVTLGGEAFNGVYKVTSLLADNADNSALISSYIGAVMNVSDTNITLSGRTLLKDGSWNTLCLPFSLTAGNIAASPLAGATIKELDNSADGTNLTDGKLTLKFTDATEIEAGKPYIVKWTTTGDAITDPTFRDPAFDNSAEAQANRTVISYDQNVKFVGQWSPFTIGDISNGTYDGDINEILYVASGNKIGYSAKARTLKSCRAHFWVKPNNTNAPAVNSINIDWGEGETTQITTTNFTNSTNSDEWYTLDGRKLNAKPNAKGVYINNGRKTVIK